MEIPLASNQNTYRRMGHKLTKKSCLPFLNTTSFFSFAKPAYYNRFWGSQTRRDLIMAHNWNLVEAILIIVYIYGYKCFDRSTWISQSKVHLNYISNNDKYALDTYIPIFFPELPVSLFCFNFWLNFLISIPCLLNANQTMKSLNHEGITSCKSHVWWMPAYE